MSGPKTSVQTLPKNAHGQRKIFIRSLCGDLYARVRAVSDARSKLPLRKLPLRKLPLEVRPRFDKGFDHWDILLIPSVPTASHPSADVVTDGDAEHDIENPKTDYSFSGEFGSEPNGRINVAGTVWLQSCGPDYPRDRAGPASTFAIFWQPHIEGIHNLPGINLRDAISIEARHYVRHHPLLSLAQKDEAEDEVLSVAEISMDHERLHNKIQEIADVLTTEINVAIGEKRPLSTEHLPGLASNGVDSGVKDRLLNLETWKEDVELAIAVTSGL